MRLLALVTLTLLFGCLGVCCAAGVDAAPAFAIQAGAASAFGIEPLLANTPTPSDADFGKWVIGFVAACSAASTMLGLVAFFRPQPALHKQFADKEDITKRLDELNLKLERWSSEHYKARGRMYRRINALENALSFLVGKMARDNDPDAERLERLLEKAEAVGGDDE